MGLIVGLTAGLLSFIPYVGSITGGVTAIGLALAQFPQWRGVAVVGAVLVIGQILEGYVIYPGSWATGWNCRRCGSFSRCSPAVRRSAFLASCWRCRWRRRSACWRGSGCADIWRARSILIHPLPDHESLMSFERLQLLLPFAHAPGYDARDFLPAVSNQEALAWLDAAWPDRRLALWGPAGCGKSHLLHIWAEQTGRSAADGTGTADLDDLPESGALALDDADTVSPEPLLLHLLNTARDRRLHILLSGRTAPSRWPVRLPDLSSRLRAITAAEIRAAGR